MVIPRPCLPWDTCESNAFFTQAPPIQDELLADFAASSCAGGNPWPGFEPLLFRDAARLDGDARHFV
jgi:hypothetical protein